MQPGAERQHLHGDVRLGGGLDQLADLRAHDVSAGGRHGPAQRVLVDDQPQPGRGRAGEDLLALQPQRYPALGFGAGGVREPGPDAGVRVVGGLQQAGYPVRVVAADRGGGFLQADKGAEPGRQHVVVAVPPAGLAGLLGQRHERVHLPGIGDAVGGQEPLDRQRLEAAFGAFHPAHRPGRGVDRPGGLLIAQPGLFPQRLQLLAQDHAQHGRGAAGVAVFAHVLASLGAIVTPAARRISGHAIPSRHRVRASTVM